MIEAGAQAPDFTLPDQDGEPVALSSLRGAPVVLYFYPKADTPGVKERAIGIVRVSQRDDDTGHSPEVQARALLNQAQSDGFRLVPGDIWDENVDGNGRVRPASGGASLDDRPKLKAAVEAIERGEATVIVAERFDRLSFPSDSA